MSKVESLDGWVLVFDAGQVWVGLEPHDSKSETGRRDLSPVFQLHLLPQVSQSKAGVTIQGLMVSMTSVLDTSPPLARLSVPREATCVALDSMGQDEAWLNMLNVTMDVQRAKTAGLHVVR
jgi:hypothetical protein